MGVARLGPIVAAVSGAVGGVVFLQSGGRSNIQGRSRPVLGASQAQFNARYWFREVQQAYAALSEDARLQWDTLARNLSLKLPEEARRNMTGRGLFQSTQGRLAAAEFAMLTDVPLLTGRPQLITMTASYVAGVLELDYAKAPDANTGRLSLRGLRSYSLTGYRRRAYVGLPGQSYAASGTLDLTADFTARLGVPAVGEWLSLEVRAIEDGGLWSAAARLDFARDS